MDRGEFLDCYLAGARSEADKLWPELSQRARSIETIEVTGATDYGERTKARGTATMGGRPAIFEAELGRVGTGWLLEAADLPRGK